MTIKDLKTQGLIIYECISGSRAYGTDLPESDTDIKGVFVLPQEYIYGLHYVSQVSNESNDVVYYELGRFIELLLKNNPNILEMLATPKDKILIKDPIINKVTESLFLSKKCKDTFGGYAFSQVKKARGLNKKIVNPIDKEKKTVLEFCYVLYEQGSVPLNKWLAINSYKQEQCGLVNIPNAKDIYGIYYDEGGKLDYKGIMRKLNATTVLLSSIPKGEGTVGYLYFNSNGYIKYCKDYKDYWKWVENRNESRYQNNIEHGKNYDSKNMMHTFRLLDMAIEILRDKEVRVERPNREELLSIRKGEWEYEELINTAERKMYEVEKAYELSDLQDEPNEELVNKLLIDLRKEIYSR